MSVEQRRTEVIDQCDGPWGKLRLAKGSSRYDRRYRYWLVEWCPPVHVGDSLEEYAYRVLANWPVSDAGGRAEAELYFQAARTALVTAYREIAQDGKEKGHEALGE